MEIGHFQALPDVVAVAADRLVAIVRIEHDGSVVVRDLANGVLRTTSASELRAPASLAAPTETTLTSIALATDAQWERARRREAVVAGLTSAPNLGDQVASAAARLGVSRRTVFRWLAAYRASPQTSSLLPRARGTPAGAHRIDEKLEQLIAEVIRDVYLTKVRAKKEEVVRRVGFRCSAEGLAPPSRKAILARVRALDVRRVAKAPSEAAALYDPVPGTYRVDRALDVVQIDTLASTSSSTRRTGWRLAGPG
jgi:putative transposase